MIDEQKKASTSQTELIAKLKKDLIDRDDAINRLGKS